MLKMSSFLDINSQHFITQCQPHWQPVRQPEEIPQRVILPPSAPPLSAVTQASSLATDSVDLKKQKGDDYYQTALLCSICMDNEKNMRIHPCGHTGCEECITALEKDSKMCHICRGTIGRLDPFFL